MAASRNGREDLELNASQDGGRILTPARLETRRGRLASVKMCGVRLEMRSGVSKCKWGLGLGVRCGGSDLMWSCHMSTP
eukprot:7281008-Prymnesium_polylepis.1